jgi:ATP-dependent Clp protease ATP-binding subunit ClpA
MHETDEYAAAAEEDSSAGSSGNAASGQVFPVTQSDQARNERVFSMRVPGLTETASNCLIKALHLARELHHGEVTAAHFIVAMTLVPRANKQFAQRHLDGNAAWRASMAVLTDLERMLSGPSSDPPLSVELINILTDARRSAENRDNQEASIDDIFVAFTKLSVESSARRLAMGVGPTKPATPAEEARDAVRRLEENLSRRFDSLNELLRRSPQAIQEPVTAGVLGWLGSQLGQRR